MLWWIVSNKSIMQKKEQGFLAVGSLLRKGTEDIFFFFTFFIEEGGYLAPVVGSGLKTYAYKMINSSLLILAYKSNSRFATERDKYIE